MQSFRLYLKLVPHIRMRWGLTTAAYVIVFAALTSGLLQPLLFSYLIDRVLIDGDSDWLMPLLAASGGLALAGALFGTAQAGLFRYLGIRQTLDLRERVLAHLRRIPITEIEREGAGKYAALMGMDTATMGNFLNHVVKELACQWYSLAFAVGMMLWLDWRLGLVTALCVPALLAIPLLFKRAIALHTGRVREHNEEIGGHLFEGIEGSREIRLHGLERWEQKRNERMYGSLVKASVKDTLYRVMSGQTGMIAVSAIVVLLYGYGSGQVRSESMTIGVLVALAQYLSNALAPVQTMNNFVGELQSAEVAMGRIESFLRSKPEEVADEPDRDSEINATWEKNFRPDIAASGLGFAANGQAVLDDIQLDIRQGDVAAFVGPSGSGKSTLFRTLLGFVPVTSGELRIGQVPASAWTRRFLSRRVGAVFQESFLFMGTIRENVALGRLDASAEEIEEAVRLAELQPLIDSLPDGLDTQLGYRGAPLSGGQRQRVAIARALLARPDVLLLDEPTSALDRPTEERVLRALFDRMQDGTTLIATHRLGTIAHASSIHVMDRGRIVDSGTHHELASRGSRSYLSLLREDEDAGREKVPV